MTHHTDAELLRDIEEHMRKMWDARLLPAVCWPADLAQRLTQAVRRAPAAPVPKGWKLKGYEDGSITVQAPSGERWRHQETTGTGTGSEFIYSLLKAMLAAAPQPPEAAPVQLPEPVAFVHTPAFVWNGNISPVVSFAKYEDDYKSGIYSLRTPLYTEQQVLELLAAHGIGKEKA